MDNSHRLIAAATVAVAALSTPSDLRASELELSSGIDTFVSDQSTIEGFHYFSLMGEVRPGFYLGQSVYSSALGDGGGAFFGGVEAQKRFRFSDRLSVDLEGFLGGGGGSGQIPGDGLMMRAGASLNYALSEATRLSLGVARVKITGSDIDTNAISLGISQAINLNTSAGTKPARASTPYNLSLSAFRPMVYTIVPEGSLKGSGQPLETMYLVGVEIGFTLDEMQEAYLKAGGAGAGDGEGFAELMFGYRRYLGQGNTRLYWNAGAGFAGGGDVDTGGGFVAEVGGGVAQKLVGGLDLQFGADLTRSGNGGLSAVAPYIRSSFEFGQGREKGRGTGDADARQDWNLTMGITSQPGSILKSAGEASPLLFETALDLFVTERVYVTGIGQTVLSGGVGGYAVGLLGLGYERALSDQWNAGFELFAGVAGGGGIDTKGGLVGGYRIEVDYALNDTLKLSLGLGGLSALKPGGLNSTTMQLGLKIPFTSWH
jgi:hypothetical protein